MTFLNIAEINKINKEIADNAEYSFNISESGIYLIEIIASAKSWWQNLKERRAFFNDDDLAVKINGIEFPKLNGKVGLFDGEAAWNGNNLKGLKKIGIFILNIKSGEHKIKFIAYKNPYLESIKINRLETGNYAEYIPSADQQAQDGNNRQWINLVFADLPIKEIAITAPGETADFIEKVKSYYEEYKNKGREGFIKIFWMIIFCGISILFGSIILSCYLLKISKNNKKEKTISSNIEMIKDKGKEKFYRLEDDLDGDGDKETVNFHFYYGEILERITEMEFQGQIFKMQGDPYGFSKDINGDGLKEVIVELAVGANGIWTEIYQLNNSGKLEIIPTIPEYKSPGFLNRNGIKFVDYDDDGKLEVRVDYNYMPDPCVGQADVYEYVKGTFIKSEELKVFEETCRESMKKVTG
ncbi:MAG: VCBS repeat-containing protein [bacterium]